MNNDLVSIITPVYNAESFLFETINAVVNQTYQNWELILVDDCSTDNSEELIKKLSEDESRIKYIKLLENSGAAVARNTGIANAVGRYIAFLDSDDLWVENKLETQIKFMTDLSVGFTYTNFRLISENGEVIKERINLPEKLNYTGLLKNTAIACSSVIIDRDLIGDFRMPNVRKGQDTATWLMLLRNHDYAYLVDQVLGSYRQVQNSISSDKLGALKRTWNTYRNIEKLPLIKASYYFIFYVVNAILRRK